MYNKLEKKADDFMSPWETSNHTNSMVTESKADDFMSPWETSNQDSSMATESKTMLN